MPKDPARLLKGPKAARRVPRFLQPAQVDALLARGHLSAGGHHGPPRFDGLAAQPLQLVEVQVEHVVGPVEDAVGRVSAELIAP